MKYATSKGNRGRRVGAGWYRDMPRTLYEAVQPISCAGCGHAIAVGERFTRHTQAQPPPLVAPFCGACRPFVALGERG